ncbi:MAG TPA: energy transducer TonB [Pyrinomonadaceae bacterium]|nr:energy transducer TonB [Pyrinomonadaceae bacterium]
MFNNLIESTSHAKEFKRRGSFVLFTSGIYALLFVVIGVISIYAYDAHLETQSTGIEITMLPLLPTEVAPEVIRNTIRPASNSETPPARSTRTELISSTSDPTHVPDKPGTVAEPVPPARPDSVISFTNADPPSPVGNRGVPGGTGSTPVVDIPDTPPPPPTPAPTPVVPKILKVSESVVRSQAISLPKPNYPQMARQIRLQGRVVVQVLIDEKGNVVSAEVISGHPFFVPEAKRAAMQSRFSPTMLGHQPVKVSGVITYNFVMP